MKSISTGVAMHLPGSRSGAGGPSTGDRRGAPPPSAFRNHACRIAGGSVATGHRMRRHGGRSASSACFEAADMVCRAGELDALRCCDSLVLDTYVPTSYADYQRTYAWMHARMHTSLSRNQAWCGAGFLHVSLFLVHAAGLMRSDMKTDAPFRTPTTSRRCG